MLLAILHNKVQLFDLCVAILCAVLAGWLSVTARVKAALISAHHAKAAMLAAVEQLRDAQRDIVSLRRQLAQVVAENEELSGRLFVNKKPADTKWEEQQSLLDKAADKIDTVLAAKPEPKARRKPFVIESSKLTFRKGPMELDPSDFETDKPKDQ